MANVTDKETGEKARKIVGLLPKLNCGKCGFDNCGNFALAVAEGKATPFSCHENPSSGYKISEIMGLEIPEEVKLHSGRIGFHQYSISTGIPPDMRGSRGRYPHRGHGMGHRFRRVGSRDTTKWLIDHHRDLSSSCRSQKIMETEICDEAQLHSRKFGFLRPKAYAGILAKISNGRGKHQHRSSRTGHGFSHKEGRGRR